MLCEIVLGFIGGHSGVRDWTVDGMLSADAIKVEDCRCVFISVYACARW